jgi:cytochrome c-type biogenesis protein CcmH/NrfF
VTVRAPSILRAAFVLALALAPLVAPPVRADTPAPTQREIEESLTCQCGCGLTVHSCNHIQCGSGEPIKKEIAERLARGESKEQILDAFTKKFGEKVLSSPTMQGFNTLAWIMPFAAVLTAGAILAMVIQRRTRQVAPAPPPAPPAGSGHPKDDALRARLERELDALDRDDSERDT